MSFVGTRRSAPRRALASALVAAGLAALTACSTPGDAADGYDQGRVVDTMASSVDQGTARSFSASYTLAGGGTVKVSHMPVPYQDALVFADGRYVSTPTYQLTCHGDACVQSDPLAPTSPLDAEAITDVSGPGFLSTQAILGLLTKAALDTNATIEQSDATLAGEHATCATVTGLTNAASTGFKACVTDRGVVGSFEGKVGDTEVDMLLVSYAEDAQQAAFDVPADANVTDERKSDK